MMKMVMKTMKENKTKMTTSEIVYEGTVALHARWTWKHCHLSYLEYTVMFWRMRKLMLYMLI